MITEKHIIANTKITFAHPKYGDKVYVGHVVASHICIENGMNCAPFKAFCDHLTDEPNDFVSEIVGYRASGSWPEVKSKEDMAKVLNAMICAAPGLVITIGGETFGCDVDPNKITLDDFFKVV